MPDTEALLQDWKAKTDAATYGAGDLLEIADIARDLLAAVEAIRALHYDAGASQGYRKDDYVVIDHCCKECGTFNEYGVEWPCATIRAIDAALSGGAS